MGLHTARLIFTVLFFVFALAGLTSGYWLQALFWALLMAAVSYPFIRQGRLDLSYDDGPTKIIVYQSAAPQSLGLPLKGEAPLVPSYGRDQSLSNGQA